MAAPSPKMSLSLVARSQGALLGLAFGDALGWPQEDRAHRVTPRSHSDASRAALQKWARWSGGRFFAHQEVIEAGEYSDDTQLALATARSLVLRTDWWTHLTSVELPFWTAYERGGGGATKRAAEAWLQGRCLWSKEAKPDERKRYFDAGGNGVAMRILPHCLTLSGCPFSDVMKAVFSNGITTHGHPRALVGALVYAFACHAALRRVEPLPYGGLVGEALAHIPEWASLDGTGPLFENWISAAEETTQYQYRQSWKDAVSEMVSLLELCADGLRQGMLSVDREVLEHLGAFGGAKGAGTVAAAAAIFLASRHAADPLSGVIAAASAEGSDADTIASMTGGLLGSIAGDDWVHEHASTIQDHTYLRLIASQLLDRTEHVLENRVPENAQIRRGDIQSFIAKLGSIGEGSLVDLPDGRVARVDNFVALKTRSPNTQTRQWHMWTADGQSLYIKSSSRETKPTTQQNLDLNSPMTARVSIKFFVKDLVKSRIFYSETMGLPITKETSNLIALGGALALLPAASVTDGPEREGCDGQRLSVVACEVPDIEAVYERVRIPNGRIVTRLSPPGNVHRVFRCLDPDGNLVEVYQLNGKAS